jgi:hypothetical protein
MKVQCRQCRKVFDVPVTDDQLAKWNGGELIQNVMPELGDDQRELLISQTCGPCFDELFLER